MKLKIERLFSLLLATMICCAWALSPASAAGTRIAATCNLERGNLKINGELVTSSVTNIPAAESDLPLTLELEAIPNEGWEFSQWFKQSSITGVYDPESSASTTFTVSAVASNANNGFGPIFKMIDYSITTPSSPEGGGTVEVSKNPANMGDEVNITATPNPGYQFNSWQVVSGGVTLADPTSASTSFTVGTQNVEIQANFDAIIYNVTTSVEGDGTATAVPVSGPKGTNVNLTATPGYGYRFKNWEVLSGGVTLADPTSATTSFPIVTDDVSVKATFEKVYTVTTSVEGEGTATATPNLAPNGETVNLTATPGGGYQFKNWEVLAGEVELADPYSATTSFSMGISPVSVKAIFDETTITGISLNSKNAKKSYTIGDELDLDNLVLTVTKSDGSTEIVEVTEDMVSGFDSSKAGKQTITVTYSGFTDTYEVEVKGKSKPVNPSSDTTDGTTNKSDKIYIPDTGDHNNFLIWILIMAICLSGLMFSHSWWPDETVSK